MIIIDLFSGAGGLSEGFHQEGYQIVAQVEKDSWACETLKTRLFYHYLRQIDDIDLYHQFVLNSKGYRNIDLSREVVYEKYPELRVKIQKEILNKKFGNPANDPESTSTKEIIRLIEESLEYNNKKEVDLIIGGPPCQAYSVIGRSRMKEEAEKDPRNYLFYYYSTVVKRFKPKAFVFENVPGILSAKKGKVFSIIKEEFNKIGYNLLCGEEEEQVIDFSNYGVHQRRKRVILFGYQKELDLGYLDFEKNKIDWDHPADTNHVISDLPTLQPGEGDDHKLSYYNDDRNKVLSKYQEYMRIDSLGILNHKVRNIQERDREIYRIAIDNLKMGKQLNYKELPTQLKTHNNQKSFLDRFKVHQWNKLPHTVVAHISKDGHYNIHPDSQQIRSLTVREAARIQSFPDNYKFEGPRTSQFVQVGNAVPPLMSIVIARAINEKFSC